MRKICNKGHRIRAIDKQLVYHFSIGTLLFVFVKKIVMLGRQAGYFLIVACQRPDAKYFSDGIRDNFNFRVGLGRISELGYGMLFGSDVKKQFFQKRIKGRGYCDVGTSVISEFYTPLVPKGHDFLQTIGRLAQERQVMPEQQGKEDVIE